MTLDQFLLLASLFEDDRNAHEHFKRPNSGFGQDLFSRPTRAAGCFAQSQLCLAEENYVTTLIYLFPRRPTK
jgi:hypothetical protein